MKLEENMYVRIKNEAGWCCIGKIENINDFREPSMKYCIDIQSEDFVFISEDMISKASHTFLGNNEEPCLIEVGDYVNGKQVIKVSTDYIFDYSEEIKIIYFSEEDYIYSSSDIKSIVTREQFEQMQYKVGE